MILDQAKDLSIHLEEFAAAFMKRNGTIDPSEVVAVQDTTRGTTFFRLKTDKEKAPDYGEDMLNKDYCPRCPCSVCVEKRPTS